MPRTEARVFTSIWNDPDFVRLPVREQRMYLFLLSQPDLSFCGRLVLSTKWWARSARGLSAVAVCESLEALENESAKPFIITDKETQELLIRSFVRRDHVLKSPKLVKPLGAALGEVRSQRLREALVIELRKGLDEGVGDWLHQDLVETVQDMVKFLETAGQYRIGYPIRKGIRYPSRYPQGQGKGQGPLPLPPASVPVSSDTGTDRGDLLFAGKADTGRCQGYAVSTGKMCGNPAKANGFCAHHDAGGREVIHLFDEFWAAYPSKVGIDAARRAWGAAVARHGSAQAIVEAARVYRDDPHRDVRFTPHPERWLSEGRYEDGPAEPPRVSAQPISTGHQRVQDALEATKRAQLLYTQRKEIV